LFLNRREAGKLLGQNLDASGLNTDRVVLGVPRGGMPVAYEVALALDAPLDAFLVRRLEVCGREDAALGVVATGGVRAFDQEMLQRYQVGRQQILQISLREESELARRQRAYLGSQAPLTVQGRTVVLVDDRLDSPVQMRDAIFGLRQRLPREIIVAVPVAASEALDEIRPLADATATLLLTPQPSESTESFYQYYAPTTDGEVRELLALSRERRFGVRDLPWPEQARTGWPPAKIM
jgi:putative phosphoribosyl transferase